MRFNAIIPIVLTLAGLVSARLSVLSPLITAVWEHRSLQTIEWKATDELPSTRLDIYLMCEHKHLTTVLFAIKKDILLGSTNQVTYEVPTSLQRCEGYFIKFITHNSCGMSNVFFSSMFSIVVNGELHKPLGVCESETHKLDKPTSTPTPAPTKQTETETKGEDKKPQHPQDDTPTHTQPPEVHSPETLPTETSDSQKPITPQEKDDSTNTVPNTTEPTSPTSSTPDKKPDIDNHGSVVTFKLFGVLLAVVTVFIFS